MASPMDLAAWDSTMLGIKNRLTGLIEVELKEKVTEHKLISLIHVIHATVKSLALENDRLKAINRMLTEREERLRNVERTFLAEKESFETMKLSIESLQSEFSNKMQVVHHEVQRAIHSREELESVECERDNYKAGYSDAMTKLTAGVKDIEGLQKLKRDLEADKNKLAKALETSREGERRQHQEMKSLNQEITDLRETLEASAVAERGSNAIKELGLAGQRMDTLGKDCLALRNENNELRQKLATSACPQGESSHGWGGVCQDVNQLMTLLPAGSKTQEELRTALGAIINMYTVEPMVVSRLGKYLEGARASSEGHQCLYNIAGSWHLDQPYQSRNCKCWQIGNTTCVLVGIKRDRNQGVHGQFQLVSME